MATENNQSNISEDLSRGVRTSADAARSARKAVSAVSKAATGNVAGAAADVLTDENLTRIVAAILLFTFFLIFCCTFLAPLALYEAIVAFLEGIVENFKIHYYEGSSGRFVSFFKAVGGVIKDAAQAGIDQIVNSTIGRMIQSIVADNATEDVPGEEDLGVIADKSDLKSTYERKIKACKDKIKARQEDIFNVIESGRVVYGTSPAAILEGMYHQDYEHKYDHLEFYSTVYDDFSWVRMSSTVSDKTALQLLCLHTVQKDMSLNDIKLSGFIKWLGYNGGARKQIEIQLGENDIWYQTNAWKGGFMPQYLMDEANQRKADYSDYACAVTDILLKVSCPNLYSLKASEREEIVPDQIEVDDYSRPIYSQAQDYSIYRRNEMPSDYYSNWVKNGWAFVRNVYCEGSYGNWLYQKSGWALMTNSNGAKELYRKSGNEPGREVIGYEKKMVDIERHIIHVSFTIPVSVSCRSINEIMKIAGLWEGFLPDSIGAKVTGQIDDTNTGEFIDLTDNAA